MNPLLSRFNSISTQIFASFWLMFALLVGLVLLIPNLDSRTYSKLSNMELAKYQQKIVTAFKENHISRLLIYQDHQPPLEPIEDIHPILFDPIAHKFLGAASSEVDIIQPFILMSKDEPHPMSIITKNTKLAGPFEVRTTPSSDIAEKTYKLYFANYENTQLNFINALLDRPISLFLAIMFFSSPLLWFLAWNIGRPIRSMHQAANRVAEGDFTPIPELEKQGVKEFRQMGRSFNQMTIAIKSLLDTRQQLLSSVSHELRTPLTRLQLTLSLLRRKTGDCPEIQRIEQETMQIDKMIDDLLNLSRTQLNIYNQQDIFHIPLMYNKVIENIKFEAHQRHVHFIYNKKIQAQTDYYIHGNQPALTSALENVLRNALKYTKDKIMATFSVKEQHLLIQIDDNGIGVADTEYEKIFEPFYRVDESRLKKIKGSGLGLTIVQNSIHLHRGKVWAEKSPLGGLRITLRIPLYTGGG